MKTNPNDPANPQICTYGQMHESGNLYGDTYSIGGLTKREDFSSKFFQAYLTGNSMALYNTEEMKAIAAYSVVSADALIEALNKEQK